MKRELYISPESDVLIHDIDDVYMTSIIESLDDDLLEDEGDETLWDDEI